MHCASFQIPSSPSALSLTKSQEKLTNSNLSSEYGLSVFATESQFEFCVTWQESFFLIRDLGLIKSGNGL